MARYKTEYNSEIDRYYRNFIQSTDVHGNWCLSGKSLIYFIRNMSLYGLESISVEQCQKDVIKVQPRDTELYRINVPANTGEMLDLASDMWTEWPQHNNVKKLEYIPRTCNGVFFNDERRKNGHELIRKMLECGKKAGIQDKMFLAFGNLLGYALIGDFLWNDDDIDINVIADDIPQDRLRRYLLKCKDAGLTEVRMHGPGMINNKYVWFSIGDKSPEHQNGVKACNWFWFQHGGFYWHSKGVNWNGISGKGIPLKIFDGTLKEIHFKENKIKAPVNIGRCLDWWYGDWMNERSCTSSQQVSLQITDEKDRSSWVIEKK